MIGSEKLFAKAHGKDSLFFFFCDYTVRISEITVSISKGPLCLLWNGMEWCCGIVNATKCNKYAFAAMRTVWSFSFRGV